MNKNEREENETDNWVSWIWKKMTMSLLSSFLPNYLAIIIIWILHIFFFFLLGDIINLYIT